MKRQLKKWPFTWEGRKRSPIPKGPDGRYDPKTQRAIIRSFLRLEIPILKKEIEFLQKHPEHAQWLKNRLEPHLWIKIEPYCNISDEAEQ